MSAPISTQEPAATPESIAAQEENLRAQGLPTEDVVPVENYWGYDFTETYYLPDKKQYLEFKRMDEGMKTEYQRLTNRKVKVGRVSGDAEMSVDPAGDRKHLIQLSVTGWNMLKPDHTGRLTGLKFSPQNLAEWLRVANPLIVEKLERAIRDANPWMKGELSSDEIKAEIATLQEQLLEAEDRERGE